MKWKDLDEATVASIVMLAAVLGLFFVLLRLVWRMMT